MARSELRVAVLGAGIMGSSIALMLASKGVRVTLVDQAPVPFAKASRWNEGKIHLGFMYAGDPTLNTARKLLQGGLTFRSLVAEMLEEPIDDAFSLAGDIFLNHQDSVVDASTTAAYLAKVSDLIEDHPDFQPHRFGSTTRARMMTAAELARVTNSEQIVSGFYVPEKSVQTSIIADRFVAAIEAHPFIEKAFATRVIGAVESPTGWQITTAPAIAGSFDVVVNALWEGRSLLDRASGFGEHDACSYRFRLSLFVRAARLSEIPNAMITTGPFGDIKNYNGRDIYLSWYPAGLIADSAEADETRLPPLTGATKAEVMERTIDGLKDYFSDVPDLVRQADDVRVEGGWVVAKGSGTLIDPVSSLHRRNDFGVTRHGSYFSVDTGKYSTAPWIARSVTREILG